MSGHFSPSRELSSPRAPPHRVTGSTGALLLPVKEAARLHPSLHWGLSQHFISHFQNPLPKGHVSEQAAVTIGPEILEKQNLSLQRELQSSSGTSCSKPKEEGWKVALVHRLVSPPCSLCSPSRPAVTGGLGGVETSAG